MSYFERWQFMKYALKCKHFQNKLFYNINKSMVVSKVFEYINFMLTL